jgi:hypothetical protein
MCDYFLSKVPSLACIGFSLVNITQTTYALRLATPVGIHSISRLPLLIRKTFCCLCMNWEKLEGLILCYN